MVTAVGVLRGTLSKKGGLLLSTMFHFFTPRSTTRLPLKSNKHFLPSPHTHSQHSWLGTPKEFTVTIFPFRFSRKIDLVCQILQFHNTSSPAINIEALLESLEPCSDQQQSRGADFSGENVAGFPLQILRRSFSRLPLGWVSNERFLTLLSSTHFLLKEYPDGRFSGIT